MPLDPSASGEVTAFKWVPDFARGQVRDLRVRWACEELGKPYSVRLLDATTARSDDYLLEQPFGLLAPAHVDGLSWLTEGLVVLAWALGRAELPRHDERASFDALASAVGLQRDEASSLLASDVRSEAELQRFLGRAYAVSWRLFCFYGDREPLDFARLGREERFWFGRLALDDVPLADGDLVVDGAPLPGWCES